MILADLVDLTVHRFEHGGDLGDLRSLREPGELVGGHGQVSAWSLVDVVTVDTEKIFVKVAMERPPLRVELVVASGLSHRKGTLVFMALRAVDVPVFTSGAFLIGFAVPRGMSMMTLKIAPPRKGRRGGCSVKVSTRVSIEP